MADSSEQLLEILKENKGFTHPEKWIGYAREHGFRKVDAVVVQGCPDCGATQYRKIGQYIYYSNLIYLLKCEQCELLYSNVRINQDTISQHFDAAYVDERYFAESRKDTFRQIAAILSGCIPVNGKVLDVGGAKGHLMAALKECRSDLTLVVNDVSRAKCEWAEQHYRFRAICATASDVCSLSEDFDAVSLIDVIYYEPQIAKLWSGLGRLVRPNGVLVLRVPNHYFLILMRQWLKRVLRPRSDQDIQDRIKGFNPEHLYVFSRSYLKRRLKQLGFERVTIVPSALLLKSSRWRPFCRTIYAVARAIHWLSIGKVVCTPSFLVIAKR